MKTDMKIGILVGVVVVAVLVIFFVNRNNTQTDKPLAEVPEVTAPIQPDPTPPPVETPPVAVEPEPIAEKPEVIIPDREEPVTLEPIIEETAQPPFSEPIAIPTPEPPRAPRYHTVAEGDSLSTISETYYGSGNFWPEIQKANSGRINNPNHLQVGWKLRIPYPDEIAGTR